MHTCTVNPPRIGLYDAIPGDSWVVNTHSCMDTMKHVFKAGQDMTGDAFVSGLQRIDSGAPAPKPGEEVRIVCFNGVGTGYGDLVCGSIAIRSLSESFRRKGFRPHITLVPESEHMAQYMEVFGRDPHVDEIQPAGIPATKYAAAHFISTSEGCVADPVFQRVNMVDYFVNRFGLMADPIERTPTLYPDYKLIAATVASLSKANEMAGDRRKVVLNFFGSGYRRIPIPLMIPLINGLASAGWFVALTAPDPRMLRGLLTSLGQRKDVVDISPLLSQSWSHYVGGLSWADVVVTTDTSAVHVCGAIDKPCVGMFAFIEPALRLRYYPYAIGWTLPQFRKSKLWGVSRPPNNYNSAMLEEDAEWMALWKDADVAAIPHLADQAWRLKNA